MCRPFGAVMDLPPETLILIVAVVIAAAVAYLELRYIRTRKQVKVDHYIEQDDAYNAVTTTRAVATSLVRNGKDTSEVDALIYQAESAYDRREFVRSLELADKAKNALKNCKDRDLMTAPVKETAVKGELGPAKEESKDVPANECRKLPQNYLESKFIIDTVRGLMPDAFAEQREAGQRELDAAQASFDAGDYSEALKCALKAKRVLAPAAPVKEKIPNVATTVIKAQASTKPPAVCGGCGAALGPDDGFCHSCGTKVGMRTCPGCHAPATDEDQFCRRCGLKIE